MGKNLMNSYRILQKQVYSNSQYSLVPLRMEDRYLIMQWRNEQIYHLRQNELLTEKEQDLYFNNVVSKLFNQERPEQILFSFLEKDKCVGYGGITHINWADRNTEISFIIDTSLEENFYELYWTFFLGLIEDVAFNELKFHKIYTYAFDLRPKLYQILEKNGFYKEAILVEQCLFNNNYIDVIIHSKIWRKSCVT